MTYHQLSFVGQIPSVDTDEGIIVLSLAQRGAVYVGRKEADRRQDAAIERSLRRDEQVAPPFDAMRLP